ncbi:gag-pol polyprotein [Tanacetum coccineum]
MQVMVEMVTGMQGDRTEIKHLMQELGMMKAIRLFSMFYRPSLLQERQCYNCNEKGHYARYCQKPRVRDAKYFREQMFLVMKDEARSNLNDEENDFMLENSYGEKIMEELTAAVMLMAQIQPADGNAETVPSYDAKAVSKVNASSKVHEQMSHVNCKTIIQTSDVDQIDSNINLMILIWKIMVAHLNMV